jgi:ABC-2 type transport system permease protein
MLRWELASLRLLVPVTAAVQALAGVGFVLGIGLLRDVPTPDALYLSGGAVVITLALVGVILAPQIIAQQKANGTYEYLRSLPVPRTASAVAWATMTFLLGLPGAAAAVAVAAWRYKISFHFGWSAVPAVLMTVTTATLIGYAMGHAIRNVMVTLALSQVMIFMMMGFSPVYFPADRLPRWLDRVNDFLPFEPMGNVIRGALTPAVAGATGSSYAVLAAWMVGGLAVSVAVVGRRG